MKNLNILFFYVQKITTRISLYNSTLSSDTKIRYYTSKLKENLHLMWRKDMYYHPYIIVICFVEKEKNFFLLKIVTLTVYITIVVGYKNLIK